MKISIYQKQKTKRKKLIRQLINDLLKDIPLNDDLKIRINNGGMYLNNKARRYYNPDNRQRYSRIILNLGSIENRIKFGYSNSYYKDRDKRLSFVKGNRKLTLYFIILHEIGHCYLRQIKQNTEYNADSFSIFYLNKLGILK
ncbi:MAG: hypothetical protein ACTSWK_17640 [Promethearchaeota archaeon]